jgi:hypothetical protein
VRERLSNRRAHILVDFESMGLKFIASVSRPPTLAYTGNGEVLERG